MSWRWIFAPQWSSLGCRGTSCLTMVFTTVCRGISDPEPGLSPASPWALTFVFAGLFLSHALYSFQLLFCSSFFPATISSGWLGLGQWQVYLGPAGIDITGHENIFWQLLTEATHALQPPSLDHANSVQEQRISLIARHNFMVLYQENVN